jgi:hypothetical protein
MDDKVLRRFLFVLVFLATSAGAEEDWEAFHHQEGITLYRQAKSQDGLIPFRASGEFKGNIKFFLMALMDHQTKPEWAPKLKKVTVHQTIKPNEVVFSEYYKTPWPASDRQFLLKGEISSPQKGSILLKAQNSLELKWKDDDHIVCDVRFLNLLLEKLDEDKTRITFSFYGDMKGWMPSWLINIIQKKWPLRFLEGLQKYVDQGKVVESDEFKSLVKLQALKDSI